MTIIESIKNNYRKVMERPKKERWEYFWEYFKWHAIIFLLLLAVLIQSIIGLANRKETVFTGYLLNCSMIADDEAFLQGFYDYAGIDSKKSEAALYTDMSLRKGQDRQNAEVFQRIMAGITIHDGDFIAGQPEGFQMCAYNTGRILADLRDFLDAEALETFSDRLYYIDGAILQKLSAPVGEAVDPDAIIYPDPHRPENMQDPIPVAIDISDREGLRDAYYYFPDTTLYLGVVINTAHPELTRQFIDYLFS